MYVLITNQKPLTVWHRCTYTNNGGSTQQSLVFYCSCHGDVTHCCITDHCWLLHSRTDCVCCTLSVPSRWASFISLVLQKMNWRTRKLRLSNISLLCNKWMILAYVWAYFDYPQKSVLLTISVVLSLFLSLNTTTMVKYTKTLQTSTIS